MLRLTNNLKALALTADALKVEFTNLQVVRWRRKPLWMPTAKSKIFRVPSRPAVPADENLELKRLLNNYRTQMKSLRKYLASKYTVSVSELIDQKKELDAKEDFVRCSEINNDWNEAIKAERNEFFEKELLKHLEVAQQRLAERKKINDAKHELAENIIRETKQQAKNFITSKNIDAAIEYALANPTDYNFSIDLDGNKYLGRNTKPMKEKQDNEEQLSVKQ